MLDARKGESRERKAIYKHEYEGGRGSEAAKIKAAWAAAKMVATMRIRSKSAGWLALVKLRDGTLM